MITGFIVLLVCQLIGDFTVHALDVPIPGPVVGMVLLLLVLRLRRPGRDSGVVRAADGLLRHLQLLFIPAGVGIIQYLPVLAGAWLPVIAGLVISWLAVLLVTAGTGVGTLHLEALLKRRGELDGAQYISFLLGPATVALALPLCRQAANIRRAAWAVIACLIAGSITAVVVAITVTKLLGGSDQLALSLAPKSTTTPVAIALSESVGGIASLTAAFTILTGILGAVAAPRLLTLLHVFDQRVRGLAIGMSSHGIGTWRALQDDPVAGAFSGLAMALNALVTAVVLPLLLATLPWMLNLSP